MKPLFSLLLSFLPFLSFANMRAPMSVFEFPSSALENAQQTKNKSKSHLEVQYEALKINCDPHQCTIDAVYYVTAQKNEQLIFTFILPAQAKIDATVNESPVESALSPLSETSKYRELINQRSHYQLTPSSDKIYQAKFLGSVKEGNNVIAVRYVQPLSIIEARYGYFVKSRFVSEFVYILGPLKEWKKAANFKINLEVSSPRKKAKSSIFDKQQSIKCTLPQEKIAYEKDKIIYSSVLGSNFPDLLTCRIGDKDLVKKL